MWRQRGIWTKSWIATVTITLKHSLCVCTAIIMGIMLLKQQGAAAPAYFISIDGLQPTLLQSMYTAGKFSTGKGFGWLLDNSLVADKAWPIVTTLTAPSHVSTITCSPPSRHGVIANEFLRDGQKANGFLSPMATEPLWRAAMRQGKKVLAVAYVGADGRTAERTADYGIAYPDPALEGRGQTLSFELKSLPKAVGWTIPSNLSINDSWRETTITLQLNPITQETRVVQILLDASGSITRLFFATTKDLTRTLLGSLSSTQGPLPRVDLYFTEQVHSLQTLGGVKRRIIVRLLPATFAGKLVLNLSKASYNNAYPATFRQQLDKENLVWPDYKIGTLNLPLLVEVDAQAEIDRFLAQVAARMAPRVGADIVLLYQPLIDALGHTAQAALPHPFNPGAEDETTQAFVTAFNIIDANLTTVLKAADATTPIAVMGDHGMDPIYHMVNIDPLLPAGARENIQLFGDGQLLMLYPRKGHDPAKADAIGAALAIKLASMKDPAGRPVLAEARNRGDFVVGRAADYSREWPYDQALWSYLNASGEWFVDRPGESAIFLTPTSLGMHGTTTAVSTMATILIVHGTGVKPTHLAATSLINAVPTFCSLIGITPPRDCIGESLLSSPRN